MNRLIYIFHITIQCSHIFTSETMDQSTNLKKKTSKITQSDKKSIFGITVLLKTVSPKQTRYLPDDSWLFHIDLAQMMDPSLT